MRHDVCKRVHEGVLLHRLSWYISGKLWSSCHHPHIDSPKPLQATTCRGFSLPPKVCCLTLPEWFKGNAA